MNKKPRCVVMESPFKGRDDVELEANKIYRNQCMYDCLLRGEFPLLSHGLYTQVLSDTNPPERKIGIDGQKAWIERCELLVVYTDRGLSEGMQEGIDHAEKHGVRIEFRRLCDDRSDTT